MKRFLSLCVSLLAAIALTLGVSAPAQAAPATVSPGVKITSEGSGFCSLAVAGRDAANRPVAFSAGHCMEGRGLGTDLFLCQNQAINDTACGKGPHIGKTATASTGFNHATKTQDNLDIDYLVILLDPDVTMKATGPHGVTVNKVGRNATPGAWLCKDGARTGRTCGPVTNAQGNITETWTLILPGDSGSAAAQGTHFVGIISHISFLKPWGPFGFTGVDGIMADLQKQGNVVGRGFVPAS